MHSYRLSTTNATSGATLATCSAASSSMLYVVRVNSDVVDSLLNPAPSFKIDDAVVL